MNAKNESGRERLAGADRLQWQRVGGGFRAVLFDFDGTLGDSYEAIAASVNHVRAAHKLPPLPVAEVRQFVGHGLPYLLEHTVPGGDPERDAARYRQHHPSVLRSGTRLLPGARSVLIGLKRRGLPIAVCSNKPGQYTRELIGYLGLAELVEAVIGPEEVSEPKPAPDMLLAAARRLGVTPADCLYVGDMALDVAAARRAGMAVWVVPTGSEQPAALAAARPDRLLERLDQIIEVMGQGAGPEAAGGDRR